MLQSKKGITISESTFARLAGAGLRLKQKLMKSGSWRERHTDLGADVNYALDISEDDEGRVFPVLSTKLSLITIIDADGKDAKEIPDGLLGFLQTPNGRHYYLASGGDQGPLQDPKYSILSSHRGRWHERIFGDEGQPLMPICHFTQRMMIHCAAFRLAQWYWTHDCGKIPRSL